jgi:transposase
MILDREECADFKPAYDLYQEFLAILRSLTYTAYYRRNGITYKTSFNNSFCESQNNKVKLIKRNAFCYKYFINLRKRILLHLGFRYTLNFEETKKG